MRTHKKKGGIEIIYKYISDQYSETRLDGVYSILFDEIQELIKNEHQKSIY